jgi:hypothetical protein
MERKGRAGEGHHPEGDPRREIAQPQQPAVLPEERDGYRGNQQACAGVQSFAGSEIEYEWVHDMMVP